MKAAVTFLTRGHLNNATMVRKFPDVPMTKYPINKTAKIVVAALGNLK